MQNDTEQLQQSRILIVDDDNITRRILTRALERSGYATSSAANADEGEEIVREFGTRNFSCAVVDYRMPGRNGIEFLTWLKSQDETLSAIMLTAEGDKQLVAKILREGAVDYLDKPVEIPDFKKSVVNAMTVTREKRRLVDTDTAAVAIGAAQLQMLGFDHFRQADGMKLCFRPMHQASGDFVGVFNPVPDKVRIIAGDVSGHDLRAAYFSTFSQGVLRGMMNFNASDQQIFSFFNNFLINEWNPKVKANNPTSIALCGVEITPSTRTIIVVNSGFPAPCLIDGEGNVSQIGTGSCPLGWFEEDTFEVDMVQAPEGSFLYLWSDGLEDYAEHLGISAFAMAQRLLHPIDEQDQQDKLKNAIDDIMIVKLEVNPQDGRMNGDTGFVPLLHKKFAGDEAHMIDKSQHWIESSLRYAVPEIGPDKLYDLILCTREALLNAMVHGCHERKDQYCDLTATYNSSRNIVRIRITDSGSGHQDTFLDAKSSDEEESEFDPLSRHTGFILMRELPDSIHTERNGSVVIMDFIV
ncbi:MAG: response regulator [Verrucomicrobia bacterium]|nr:response regulator [Verrucomicrobiota bacterium]